MERALPVIVHPKIFCGYSPPPHTITRLEMPKLFTGIHGSASEKLIGNLKVVLSNTDKAKTQNPS